MDKEYFRNKINNILSESYSTANQEIRSDIEEGDEKRLKNTTLLGKREFLIQAIQSLSTEEYLEFLSNITISSQNLLASKIKGEPTKGPRTSADDVGDLSGLTGDDEEGDLGGLTGGEDDEQTDPSQQELPDLSLEEGEGDEFSLNL